MTSWYDLSKDVKQPGDMIENTPKLCQNEMQIELVKN